MGDYTVEELEVMLKQAYERRAGEPRAYTEDVRTNAAQGYEASPSRPMTTAEWKTREIARRALEQKTEAEKADMVLTILRAHPEFFDFLEVLKSGLV